MTPKRWKQINKIFHATLAQQPHRRAAFLSTKCGGDGVLFNEIESLINSYEKADWLELSPVASLIRLLEDKFNIDK